MKKLMLILVFTSLSFLHEAQGNLQFNQVKLVTTAQTVPAGKVWKVESCTYNGGAAFYVNNGAISTVYGLMSIVVNGVIIPVSIYVGGNSSSFSNAHSFPMWLPAGSTIATGTNAAFVSVIEFNVVP